jgi:serine protease inhibitor
MQSRLRQLEKVAEIHQYPYPSTGIPEVVQRNVTVAEEINTLRQQIDPYELNIANALWGEQTFPLKLTVTVYYMQLVVFFSLTHFNIWSSS